MQDVVKTAPDVVKGSPNPGCSLERKLPENVTLTPLPQKEQGQGRSLNTGSAVKCQFNAMTRATPLAKIKYRSTIRRRRARKLLAARMHFTPAQGEVYGTIMMMMMINS